MLKLKRNQVIITALVVMIGVAGYLNHIDQGLDVPVGFAYTDDGTIGSIVTDVEAVPADMIITTLSPMPDEEAETETAVATFVNTIIDDSTFFVQARLEREQSRSRQREVLLELINNDNIEQEVRAESAEAMLTIQRRIEMESAAEALIEARGFNEVFVRMGDNSVDVVVNKDALTDSELAQIEDIIVRKTGVSSNEIRISPMRESS